MVRRSLEAAFNAIELALAIALVAAVLLNVGNVASRYLFGFTVAFADEVELYALVFITFLGAAVVSWRRTHLRMDIFVLALPRHARRMLSAAEAVLVFALTLYFAYHSWSYAARMLALDRRSDIANLPMWVPNGALAAGFALMALVSLVHLLLVLTRPQALEPPPLVESAS